MIAVLYVDDEPALLRLTQIYLEGTGLFAVDTARSAEEAQAKLAERRFDAIVSDYQMPGMDGIEFLKHVRSRYHDLPFILLTGKGREEVAMMAINNGADFYLQKGGNAEAQFAELANQIRQAVRWRRAEQALRESEKQFRGIAERSSDIIFIGDRSFRITYISPSVERILGYAPEEVVGRQALSFVVEEDQPAICQTQIDDTEGRFHTFLEVRVRKKDGSIAFLELNADPIYKDGQFGGIQANARDVSDRKKAEEALRISESRLRSIFSVAPIGVGLTSNRIILEANDRLCEMTGYSRGELVGKPGRMLYPTDEEFEYVGREKYAQIELTGSGTVETRWRRKDGSVRDILLSSTPLDPADRAAGITFTALDITERKQAERELNKSQKKFQDLTETNVDFIWETDLRGRYTYCSPQMETLWGLKPEEMIGKTPFDQMPPQVRERALEEFMRTVTFPSPFSGMETTAYDGRGNTIFIETSGVPFFDDNGALLGYRGISRDITARKRTEEALRKSETLFRSVVQNSSDMFTFLDERGTIIYASPVAERVLGYRAADRLGDDAFAFIHPDDVDTIQAGFRELVTVRKGTRATHQFRLRRADGSWIWVEATGDNHLDDPKIRAVVVVFRDVTERWEAEEALRKSEERFRGIAERSSDLILMLDERLRPTYVSPSVTKILGYLPDEVIGQSLDMRIMPQDDINIVMQALAQDPAKLTEGEVEIRINRRDGSTAVLAAHGVPIVKDGALAGVQVHAHDITARKQAEEALLRANRQLNILSSVTRHDIVNKIMVLRGYCGIAQSMARDPEMVRVIGEMESVARVINDQIAFTRIYKDLGSQAPQWQEVSKILPYGHVPPEISFTVDCAGLEVYADVMLKKVFYNLLDNSLRHGVCTSAIRVACAGTDSGLVIAWEDNGIGIPDDEKGRIFEGGFGKNTGLGLFIAREILSITGMEITERGRYLRGARFEILVPKGEYRRAKAA